MYRMVVRIGIDPYGASVQAYKISKFRTKVTGNIEI